jgi:hypothetical protein
MAGVLRSKGYHNNQGGIKATLLSAEPDEHAEAYQKWLAQKDQNGKLCWAFGHPGDEFFWYYYGCRLILVMA